MVEIAFVLIVFTVAAVIVARRAPIGTAGEVFGYALMFFLAAGIAWFILLFMHVVPIDAIARRSFGVYYLEPWLGTIVGVPPLVSALVFGVTLWGRSRTRR